MSLHLNDPLQAAIDAMRDAPVPDESLRRALTRARQLDGGAAIAMPPPGAPRTRPKRFSLRLSMAAAGGRKTAQAVAALLAVIGVASAVLVSVGRENRAFAEVRNALESIASVHLLIQNEADGASGPVEVWYRRGRGFAMQSPLGLEIDDGASHWDYSRSQKLVVRSKSRLGDGGYPDARRLGKVMGFYVDDLPDALPRLAEKDRAIDTDRCTAYVWLLKDELLPDDRVGQPDEIASGRRIVFLIDGSKRIRRCDYERGLDSKWKPYRTVEISYTDDIPADRFKASFAEDVRVVDAPAHGTEGAAIDPDVAHLEEGVQRRQSAYEGLRFTLLVTTEEKRSPTATRGEDDPRLTNGVLEARDVFAALGPQSDQSARRWRFWQREVKNAVGQWALQRFVAFNGSQTNSFDRWPSWDHRAWYRVEPAGSAVPWEAWPEFEPNRFDSFLFHHLNGFEDWVVAASDDLRFLHLDRFHIVGRRRSNDREVLTLLGKGSAEFGVESRVEVTGEPDFMILRREARYAKQNNELLGLYEIEELAEFNGVRYPAKGRYHQAGIGELHDVRYEFKVISVETLPDDARQHWLPPWPPSTIVRDQTESDASTGDKSSAQRAKTD
ncbi:MAG TPA: hypothetical protein VNH11_29380 [Pirellulales bacterium]|nr:hypothetical protein [Pirellulales bacterium]